MIVALFVVNCPIRDRSPCAADLFKTAAAGEGIRLWHLFCVQELGDRRVMFVLLSGKYGADEPFCSGLPDGCIVSERRL